MIKEQKHIDLYYEALLNRDEDFVGIFYVGVKTTGVFCIATCRARKPKKENVTFFESFKMALENGFRPCKVCKPTENANKPPEEVSQAISLCHQNLKSKITDYDLEQRGISPHIVRRWFKKYYGISYHAYQRMIRINTAFQEVSNGEKTTDLAFDAGFESLSGFTYTFKKIIGQSPKNSIQSNVILIHRFTTPIGAMFVCATNEGICLLEFTNRKMLETELSDLQKRFKAKIIAGENKFTKQAEKEISEYFTGIRKEFEVNLDVNGTDFQIRAWDVLKLIPYGNTITYKAQALMLKNEKAIRAVATANGYNKLAIIIPCHRVIGSNGDLTGYGGGLARKKWLLDFEKENLRQ